MSDIDERIKDDRRWERRSKMVDKMAVECAGGCGTVVLLPEEGVERIRAQGKEPLCFECWKDNDESFKQEDEDV